MEVPEPAPRLTYQPALDGLRAVALLGVVAYHSGINAMRGGFLGVSSFFTLSGFLITSLLVVERTGSGRISLGSFWARRLRRLLPAALMTIGLTVVVFAFVADDSQLSRLRADALSSLFHFSNWRFIAEGDTYGALFQSPSPFRHFWSLAVEEQYYVVFPLLMTGGLWLCGGPTRRFVVGVVMACVVAVAWPALLLAGGASSDRLYFGTDTRLAELLLGAVLALWWVSRGSVVPGRARAHTVAGVGAAGVLAAMWITAHPGDDYLYRGGLALHAALTLVVIVAAVAPSGLVRSVLSVEPLRLLGVVSYGAYLVHWPVLLLLQQESSLGPYSRFVVGLAITVVLAWLSHVFIESPVRHFSTATVRSKAWLVVPASGAAAALVFAITAWRGPAVAPIDFAAAEASLEELATSGEGGGVAPDVAVDTPPLDAERASGAVAPVRLATFGDSTALMTGLGLAYWAEEHPEQLEVVVGRAKLGCGLVTGGTRRLEGREVVVPGQCDPWLTEWIDIVRDADVDVAVVQLGAWDIVDHQLDDGEPFLAIGTDASYESMLVEQLDAAVSALLDHVDLVALVVNPDVGEARLDAVPAGVSYPEYDPARSVRWRELVEDLIVQRADVVGIDMATWISERDDDRRLRPDGVHFSDATAAEVADWLAPAILMDYRAVDLAR